MSVIIRDTFSFSPRPSLSDLEAPFLFSVYFFQLSQGWYLVFGFGFLDRTERQFPSQILWSLSIGWMLYF